MPEKNKITKRIVIIISVIILLTMPYPRLYSHILGNADTASISIEEKPGSMIPLDLQFFNEKGKGINLRDVVKGPTILTILYYRCPNVCSLVVSSLASVLRNSGFSPGKEPNIVTLTINENETPADAIKTKKIAFEIIQKPYPAEKWNFLTGSKDSIDKITKAVGYRFVKNGNEYDHPIGLIILSPEGKVVRYIMGTDYLPIDITMSLMEASTGTIKPTISRVLRFCLSYDPKSHIYVFNILRISAIVISTLPIIFIAFLIVSGIKRQKRISGGSK
jgi:protein SCO1/2